MAKKSVSPERILGCLPHVRRLRLISIIAFTLVNLVEIAVHSRGGSLLADWLGFWHPLTTAMAHVIPAFDQLPENMSRHMATDRIDIVLNVITLNWMTSIIFIGIGAVAVAYDFLRDGQNISYAVRDAFKAADRDFSLMCFFYLAVVIVIFLSVWTEFLYVPPIGLYYRDGKFLFIGFMFFCFYSVTLSSIVLVITLQFEDVRWLKSGTAWPFLSDARKKPPK